MEQQDPRTQPQSSFRGLYRYVKISVKTLDKMIVGGIIVLVLLLAYGIANNGYTVSFDSRGGTDVASQDKMYGDLVDVPEPPTREGYVFTGWYADENCVNPWDMENYIVNDSMTLYAGWEKIE